MLKSSFERFDWDRGNLGKCTAHGVTIFEIEGALAAGAMVMIPDASHSEDEDRYICAGRNASDRPLFVVVTFRTINGRRALRPITARYMHRKEAEKYEQARSQADRR